MSSTKRSLQKYQLLAIVCLCILLISTIPNSKADFTEFENTYAILGTLEIIDEGKYGLTGKVEIDSSQRDNVIEYDHNYQADAIVTSEAAEFKVLEFRDKTTDASEANGTAIGNIWDVFSNFGENEVYSFYHLTDEEITNNQIKILNFTASITNQTSFFASQMEQEIQVNEIFIDLPGVSKITAFYDITHNILVGFEVIFRDDRVAENSIYTVKLSITDTNVDFASEKRFPFALSVAIGSGIILLGTIIFFIIRKIRQPKEILKGGLN